MKKILVGSLAVGKEEKKAINDVLASARISEGPCTAEFENKWAEYIGTKYCVATSSGTAALITALTSLKYLYKLEGRKKVITSPLTYIADANAIVLSGFEPVFVDIDRRTLCITAQALEKHLKSAKRPQEYSIILPVDLMGFPVEIDKIGKIAKSFNLHVLEDAAQAHGTEYKGNKCGSQAEGGIFSFYIAHNIQAGEMGAITTNNHDLYRILKKVKTNGRMCECKRCTRQEGACPMIKSYKGKDDFDPRFCHDLIGYNFKTMEFQSALANVQLKKIEKIIKKRQENVRALNIGLRIHSKFLQLPLYSEQMSYLAYPIVLKESCPVTRKELRYELEKRGIETRPLFGSIPTQQPAYAYLKPRYEKLLPNADYAGRNGFYIGCHQYLGESDIEYIIKAFFDIVRE